MQKQDCIYFNLWKVNPLLATLESALSVDNFNLIQNVSEKKNKKKRIQQKKNISLFISLIKLKNNKNFYNKNCYKLAEQ